MRSSRLALIGSSIEIHSDKFPILPLDRFVAFARAFLQGILIQDLDSAARVFDKSGILERVSNHGHACAPYPEHFREIFLGEHQLVAAR